MLSVFVHSSCNPFATNYPDSTQNLSEWFRVFGMEKKEKPRETQLCCINGQRDIPVGDLSLKYGYVLYSTSEVLVPYCTSTVSVSVLQEQDSPLLLLLLLAITESTVRVTQYSYSTSVVHTRRFPKSIDIFTLYNGIIGQIAGSV